MPALPAIGANVYIVTRLEGLSASLLLIEESAYLYYRTATKLIECVLLEIVSLAQCHG